MSDSDGSDGGAPPPEPQAAPAPAPQEGQASDLSAVAAEHGVIDLGAGMLPPARATDGGRGWGAMGGHMQSKKVLDDLQPAVQG